MNEMPNDMIDLTKEQAMVIAIVKDHNKRKLSTHILKAFIWIGPGILCAGLGLFTNNSFYYVASIAILLIFISIQILVHHDFMNKMSDIINTFEQVRQRSTQHAPPAGRGEAPRP